MKIVNVEIVDSIYTVEYRPSKLKRLFGVKNKIKKYRKDTGYIYWLSRNPIFYKEDGSDLKPSSKEYKLLINWIRRIN